MADETNPIRSGTGTQTRRGFIAAAGATSATALAGCLGGSGNAGTIKLAVSSGDGQLIKRLLKRHVESEVDVQTSTTILPNANLFEKVSAMFQNEETTYDIVAMDDPWMPRFAQHLAPIRDHISDLPTDQIIQKTLDIGTWPTPGEAVPPNAQDKEPTLKALCAVGNSHIFVVNERLYSQVGEDLPKTWDDVYRAGRKISNRIDGSNGYAMRGKSGNPITSSYFSVGMSIAGNMFDSDWNYDWADDQGRKAASFFLDDLKSISPSGVASFDNSQVLTGLADGSVAAAPQWPSGTSLLLNEDKAAEYDNISFVPIPEGEERAAPVQGNWLLGINKYISSERKGKAADLLKSFVSKTAQDKYVDMGGVPFRHDTFKDNMDQQPWFEALYGSLQNAKPRPRTPLWSEIETAQGQPLNSALVDEMSVDEAMSTSESEIESILSENGY